MPKRTYILTLLCGFLAGALTSFLLVNERPRSKVSALQNGIRAEVVETYQASTTGLRYARALADFINRRRAGIEVRPEELQEAMEHLDGWLLSDPTECLSFFNDTASADFIADELVDRALDRISDKAPTVALDFALRLSSSRFRDRVLEKAFSRLVTVDANEAMQNLEMLPSHLQSRLRTKLGVNLVETERELSLGHILDHPQGSEALFVVALGQLAQVDPIAGLNYVKGISSDRFSKKWGNVNFNQYYARLLPGTEPQQEIAFLQQLSPSPFRNARTLVALGNLLAKRPDDAVAIVANSPGDSNILKAAAHAAAEKATANPLLSATLINAIPGERVRENLIRNIVDEFGKAQQKEATTWVNAISDPLSKSLAIEQLVRRKLIANPPSSGTLPNQ